MAKLVNILVPRKSMSHIYIISDSANPSRCRYKVGCHTGTINSLIDKYISAIPDLCIELFLEVENAKALVNGIRESYRAYRVENMRSQPSKWYSGVTLEELEFYIANRGSEKIMLSYRLDQLDLGPVDRFVLELIYNTSNGLSTEEIHTLPVEDLNMDTLADLYMDSDKTGKYDTVMLRSMLKDTVISELNRSLNKYLYNSSILELNNTKNRIKSTGCLYSNIPWTK